MRQPRAVPTSGRPPAGLARTACLTLIAGGLVTLSSPAAASTPAAASCDPADAAAVIAWNDTAAAAIGIDAALPAPTMGVGMAYVQAAVYNAVVGITREHDLYKWNVRGPRGASIDAAVAAAAHDVLAHYFPVAAHQGGGRLRDGARRDPRRAAQDGRRRLRRAQCRAPARPTGRRRLARPGHLRQGPHAGRLAADTGRLRPLSGAMARRHEAVPADLARPVPAGSAAAAVIRGVRAGPARGPGGRIGDQHQPDRGTDCDRPILHRQPQLPAAGRLPRSSEPTLHQRLRRRAVPGRGRRRPRPTRPSPPGTRSCTTAPGVRSPRSSWPTPTGIAGPRPTRHGRR